MPWYAETPLAGSSAGAGAATGDPQTPESPIYLVGGAFDEHVLATAAAYDTQARTWSPLAPMPTARCLLGVTATAGRIHALGGIRNAFDELATHEVYLPADDAWTPAAPLPTARSGLAAATGPDGIVYVMGGTEHYPESGTALAAVDAYDPATDTWESRAPMPTARWAPAAVTSPDGLIYAIGGANDDECATVEAYDPVADTWSTRPSLPAPASGLGAAVGPGGIIIVVGGYRDPGTTDASFGFDPANPSKPWQVLAPMPTPRALAAVATGPDGLIYAFGGQRLANIQTLDIVDVVEAYAYDPPERVFDHVPILIGRLIGGVASDGAGGILIGDQFIPIPPRSPLMSAILELAGARLTGAVADSAMGELGRKLRHESAAKRWGELLPARRPQSRS